MIKRFCDACKNEIKPEMTIPKVVFEYLDRRRELEVCRECFYRVKEVLKI